MNPRLQGEHRSGRPEHMILAGLTLWLLAGACSPSATLEPTAHVDSTWERVQSTGRIIVGTTGDYAPFEYYNAEYRLDGFDVALIREVAERLGLRVELHDYAFDGLGAALAIGQVDAVIAAISVTDEREALVDFTDVYHVDKGVVVTREGSAMGPVSSVPDLARYRVGVEAGSVFQADLERLVSAGEMPSKQVHLYATAAEGTADLLRGKLDLLVLDEAAAKSLLAQGGLEIADEGMGTRRYAIAIPQGAATLQSELNRALRELTEDGTLARLSDRYLGAPPAALYPLPTPTPGATPTPPPVGCLDAMARIGELSYDDDEMRNPPQIERENPFSKGWRLRNVGTCTWTEDYVLRYIHGNRPEAELDGGPVFISGEVGPGETQDLVARLRSPAEPGTYQGFWQMFNASGHAFGETVWVGITVPTETPSPTATSTPGPTVPTGPLPTWTPTPAAVVGPKWVLVSIQDPSGDLSDPVQGADLTAVFTADGEFYGNTGCNSYAGNYEAEEVFIKITNFSFTRDACPTDELNDQENRFLPFMEKSTRYAVDGNQLQLLKGDNVTLVFQGQ